MPKSKFNIDGDTISLIIYDFDGVMTDNRVLTIEDGREAVWVHRSDGLGIDLIKQKGIPQLILSTETNSVVKARAKKVKLPVLTGIQSKRDEVEKYCKKHKFNPNKVLFVGNDINDLEAMKIVGFPVAPADAHPTIQKISVLILKTRGGHGVIRELADRLR